VKTSRQKAGGRRQLDQSPTGASGRRQPREAISFTPWLQPGDNGWRLENGTVSNGFVARGKHQKPFEKVRRTIGLPNHRAEATVLMRSLRATLNTPTARASLSQPVEAKSLTNWRAVVLLFCVLPVSVFLVNCGKRRPPLPPIERVQQRTEALSGVQRGNQVLLSWPAPQRNAPDGSVQSIRRVDIYRLAEKPRAPLGLTEEEFATRSTLIGSVTYDQIKNADDVLTYTDTLEFAGEPARLRYAVRYVNASGQRAAFSNFLVIEPAARIAQAPTLNKTDKEVSEDAITISWKPPTANIDGSTPVNLLGYNVYRMEEGQDEISETPINSSPVAGTEYSDKNFKFGENYRYVVRAVSLGTEGGQVESLNSNSISVTPVDTFRPSAPRDIRIGPAQGLLSLFFPANLEADIAGYNIFRSTDPDLPKDKWTRLNSELLTKTTFHDEKVESGKQYYYYLIAVDRAGNISEPSEVVSETVP
jgi:fibronectin type 3 domain-containing protein